MLPTSSGADMLAHAWVIPLLPLAGFALLTLLGGWLRERGMATIGVGTMALAALAALAVAADFLLYPPQGDYARIHLWQWISADRFVVDANLYVDPLAIIMMLVITVVGFLIHFYSAEYMHGDEGYRRYFAYLNLFVGSMLVLVLADNLLLLFLGWEGVGVCSYLLIGHWYRNSANGYAARKALIVTRAGDTAFAVAMLLLFTHFGTLVIQPIMRDVAVQWPPGATLPIVTSALLLAGAVGKSAQAPLQVWLPDAMAGPTPVSALIHAATMVTAGVYLIARAHVLFAAAPPVLFAVAVTGAVTLLLAAGAALAQHDIKRILAYSTISQIGYMFLALGVGAWSAAIFHLMTHAFFKALLFLSAGVVIQALGQEHDIFRMGGLRRALPAAYWGFIVGGASLAAVPWVTAGFYSKDQILWSVWASPMGGPRLWAAGWIGAMLTGLYTFRLVFTVFFGTQKREIMHRSGLRSTLPLLVLAVLSLGAGFVWLPGMLGTGTLLADFLQAPLPPPTLHGSARLEWLLEWSAVAASLGGILLAYLLFLRRQRRLPLAGLAGWAYRGWGFDRLYEALWLRPYLYLAYANRHDYIDAFYEGLAELSAASHVWLSLFQDGRVRHYAAGMAAGAVLLIAIAVWL